MQQPTVSPLCILSYLQIQGTKKICFRFPSLLINFIYNSHVDVDTKYDSHLEFPRTQQSSKPTFGNYKWSTFPRVILFRIPTRALTPTFPSHRSQFRKSDKAWTRDLNTARSWEPLSSLCYWSCQICLPPRPGSASNKEASSPQVLEEEAMVSGRSRTLLMAILRHAI